MYQDAGEQRYAIGLGTHKNYTIKGNDLRFQGREKVSTTKVVNGIDITDIYDGAFNTDVHAYRNNTQVITPSRDTLVEFNKTVVDVESEFDVSESCIKVKDYGNFITDISLYFDCPCEPDGVIAKIIVNGAEVGRLSAGNKAGGFLSVAGMHTLNLKPDDKVQIKVWTDTQLTLRNEQYLTFFKLKRI